MTFELTPDLAKDLPPAVATILQEFVATLADTLPLECVILFGSAAEGRLRPTSDVNLLVIANDWTLEQLDAVRTVRFHPDQEQYVMEGDHDERLEQMIAAATGPVRASAATVLALRDGRSLAPKAALEALFAVRRPSPRSRGSATPMPLPFCAAIHVS